MMNILTMQHFNSLDWRIDETGLFADNIRTGERILAERFNEGALNGIKLTQMHSGSI